MPVASNGAAEGTAHDKARPSTHAIAHSPSSPIYKFSAELLLITLEHLHAIDFASVHTARLVSRSFNNLATGIAYSSLWLHPDRTVDNVAAAREHIARYTRHVTVLSSSNVAVVDGVLGLLTNLTTLTWRCIAVNGEMMGTATPKILIPTLVKFPHANLHIDNLAIGREMQHPYLDGVVGTIPPSRMTSLSIARPMPLRGNRLERLKKLILASPNLTSFSYADDGQGRCFNFSPGERMPRLQELRLRSYNWNHAKGHWDLSLLHTLDLAFVPIYKFFASVNLAQLANNLRCLRLHDYSAHLDDRRKHATECLSDLLRNHVRALEELDVLCFTKLLPIDAITAHPTLRILRLADHVGFGDESRPCPTLHSSDVFCLATHLPHLVELELDLDYQECNDVSKFLAAIAAFPSLSRLVLRTQTQLRPLLPLTSPDPDYDAARALAISLITKRAATPPNPAGAASQSWLAAGGRSPNCAGLRTRGHA